jgi:hypothetical protein
MDVHEYRRRIKALVKHMENPWFKGNDPAEDAFFKKVYLIWIKLQENTGYTPTAEDATELQHLESNKPRIPFPYRALPY